MREKKTVENQLDMFHYKNNIIWRKLLIHQKNKSSQRRGCVNIVWVKFNQYFFIFFHYFDWWWHLVSQIFGHQFGEERGYLCLDFYNSFLKQFPTKLIVKEYKIIWNFETELDHPMSIKIWNLINMKKKQNIWITDFTANHKNKKKKWKAG